MNLPAAVKQKHLDRRITLSNPITPFTQKGGALGEFVFYRTYSRYLKEEGRRETWYEAVERYMRFMSKVLGKRLSPDIREELFQAILSQEVLPSMRLLWSAGEAVEATNAAAYNCSYIVPAKWKDFGEILYLLMCGCGVGYSVEEEAISQLPPIAPQQEFAAVPTVVIADTREGWADAIAEGMCMWAGGYDITFDYSKLRPSGARLSTMGGRSSGPGPLKNLLDFARERVLQRQGKQLRAIDVHDIICKIGEVVQMGGVRRSSLIALSDLDDEQLRTAKSGNFYATHPERSVANISAVYHERPSSVEFMREFLALAESGSGERGIFNRGSLVHQLPERRLTDLGGDITLMGVNPCGEINLLDRQFCNLTVVVCRPGDTTKQLRRKVHLATILGTFQSMLTDFPYISQEWAHNCKGERLLGVSLTGVWDCDNARNPGILALLRHEAVHTNAEYADSWGIANSTAVTSIKPSGNTSQLVDTASGLHVRYAPYYVRRVRISATDPLFQLFKDSGYPYEAEVGQNKQTASTYVLAFPVSSPRAPHYSNTIGVLDQLRHWRMYKRFYTEHNPSCTVYVGQHEWLEVAAWVYRNWDEVGGLTFLPKSDHVYSLAPYEEISSTQYAEMVGTLPTIDYSLLDRYEADNGDDTGPAGCDGEVCELELPAAG
jgi:ribonucleoside-diphosphate reductase alpha chain